MKVYGFNPTQEDVNIDVKQLTMEIVTNYVVCPEYTKTDHRVEVVLPGDIYIAFEFTSEELAHLKKILSL